MYNLKEKHIFVFHFYLVINAIKLRIFFSLALICPADVLNVFSNSHTHTHIHTVTFMEFCMNLMKRNRQRQTKEAKLERWISELTHDF